MDKVNSRSQIVSWLSDIDCCDKRQRTDQFVWAWPCTSSASVSQGAQKYLSSKKRCKCHLAYLQMNTRLPLQPVSPLIATQLRRNGRANQTAVVPVFQTKYLRLKDNLCKKTYDYDPRSFLTCGHSPIFVLLRISAIFGLRHTV